MTRFYEHGMTYRKFLRFTEMGFFKKKQGFQSSSGNSHHAKAFFLALMPGRWSLVTLKSGRL